MRLARKPRLFGDVDVSEFSDLAFLLIIFFVLTTTFVQRMGTQTSIPSSTTDPEHQPEHEHPMITLTAERMLLDEAEVNIETLRTRLAAMRLAERPDDQRAIIVESAPDVTYERYFQAVSAVAGAGGVLALVEHAEEVRQ